MPVEVVTFLFSNEYIRKSLQVRIIFQCAPFLKGLKAACMVSVEKEFCQEFQKVFEGTDMEYKILSENKGRRLVFLYRRNELSAYLRRDEVRNFLENYGYSCEDFESALGRLSERVCRYACENRGFPHEIGAFLNYPIEDVKAFIKQGGKGEIMNGYWKVYHNPRRARFIFQAYDKAQTSAVNEYLAGRSIREIGGRKRTGRSFFCV